MPIRNTVAASSVGGRRLVQGREENGHAKGVVSITVASDLNNLLLAIIEYADLALVGLPKASQRQADIERIRTAAQLAAELITISGAEPGDDGMPRPTGLRGVRAGGQHCE